MPAALPDSFYEVDESFARQLMASYRRSSQLANAPLEAKAIREAEARKQLERHPTTLVRVRFPDRLLLQGQFGSTETGAWWRMRPPRPGTGNRLSHRVWPCFGLATPHCSLSAAAALYAFVAEHLAEGQHDFELCTDGPRSASPLLSHSQTHTAFARVCYTLRQSLPRRARWSARPIRARSLSSASARPPWSTSPGAAPPQRSIRTS